MQLDELIPNAKLARRLGTTTRSLFRWTTQPELNFPKPRLINGRRYFSSTEIEAWKRSRVAGAAFDPAPHRKAKPSLIDRANASVVEEDPCP